MITLRELREKDAPLMLEWMHESDVQKYFNKNMLGITLDGAREFCRNNGLRDTINEGSSIHMAIADEQDEYLGTVSLKDISLENRNAEYAVSLRRKARGRGIGKMATLLILNKAFKELTLHRVYLSVCSDNIPARKMYEKCGFQYEGKFREHLIVNDRPVDWCWYGILDYEYSKIVNEERNCEWKE